MRRLSLYIMASVFVVSGCDDTAGHARVASSTDPSKELDVAFPSDHSFDCDVVRTERNSCWHLGVACDEGRWCCQRRLALPPLDRADDVRGLCSLSLVAGVTQVECPDLD